MHCSSPLLTERGFVGIWAYQVSGAMAHLRCVSQPSAAEMDEYLSRLSW